MKKIIILCTLLLSLNLFSQEIELLGGLNKNRFFDYEKTNNAENTSYGSELGYVIRLGIEDIKLGKLKLRFTLSYDKYGGQIKYGESGHGGGYTTDAEINKSVLSLGIFPINFKIKERLDLNFGFEFSALMHENLSGSISTWTIDEPDWASYDLNERYDRISAKYYVGARGRIAYDFKINEQIAISPQYSYYLGLSNDFEYIFDFTKSMRHYFCIGLQWKI